ncbi:MAG: class I SAM-dependent methyltransferase [Nitrospinota bacterium]|nr:class I SAM-dependent methyltransferase [Nitrospinota bacterium]
MSVWLDEEQSRFFLTVTRNSIPMTGQMTDLMLRVADAYAPNPLSILDLGCGAGALGGQALERWPGSSCVFLDFSDMMLAECRNALAQYGKRAHFLLQNITHPQWAQACQPFAPFDLVVSGFAIHHTPDTVKQRVYEEIFQMLRPGGVFLNMEHVACRSIKLEDIFRQIFRENVYASMQNEGSTLDRASIDKILEARAHKDENFLTPVEDQCAWLRQTGFVEVDCFFKITELALFGGVKPL